MNKINIKYNLLQRKDSNHASVILSVTWEAKRVQIASGINIHPELWDNRFMRLKRSASNAFEYNQLLNEYQSRIELYYSTQMAAKVTISKNTMRDFIRQELLQRERKIEISIEKDKSLIDYYNDFIADRKSNAKFTYKTIQSYETTKRHLAGFLKSKKLKVTFEDINEELMDKFVIYLTTIVNRNNNSADSILKTFKTFLNWCAEKELANPVKFNKVFSNTIRSFRLKTESKKIALTEEEIKQIENFSPETKRRQKVKDLFLILIYTGMRYSDLKNLKSANIDYDQGHIVIVQKKTSHLNYIPIHSRLRVILEKYREITLPVMANQKFNDDVKILCKEAGLTRKEQVVNFYGKKRIDEIKERWELCSSHIGRNTFITTTLKKNVIPEKIMKITGHRSRSAFQSYVKMSKEEAMDDVRSAWEE